MTASTPTRWPTITKDIGSLRMPPNLENYEATPARFRWDAERRTLAGLPACFWVRQSGLRLT